jgi:hypothetical protein
MAFRAVELRVHHCDVPHLAVDVRVVRQHELHNVVLVPVVTQLDREVKVLACIVLHPTVFTTSTSTPPIQHGHTSTRNT